jgi:hypothetical protein
MDYHVVKSAVNRFLLRYAGWDHRPVFFDIDEICPQLHELEKAYLQIRAELDALLAERVEMPNYHDVNPPATEISSTTPGHWKVYMLELLGRRPARNRRAAPRPALPSPRSPASCRRSSPCSRRESRCRSTPARTSATCAITWACACRRTTRRSCASPAGLTCGSKARR